jgi:hypothetical protein
MGYSSLRSLILWGKQNISSLKGWYAVRDFSWKYFTMTGDVESYLLYKEMDHQAKVEPEEEEDIIPDETEWVQ